MDSRSTGRCGVFVHFANRRYLLVGATRYFKKAESGDSNSIDMRWRSLASMRSTSDSINASTADSKTEKPAALETISTSPALDTSQWTSISFNSREGFTLPPVWLRSEPEADQFMADLHSHVDFLLPSPDDPCILYVNPDANLRERLSMIASPTLGSAIQEVR